MIKAIFQAQTPYGLERDPKNFDGYRVIDVPVVDLNLDYKLEGLNGTNEVAFVTVEKKERASAKITVVWNLQRNMYNYTDLNDRTYYDYQQFNESKIKLVAIEKLKSDPEYSFLYLP
jgi:hypothetical protein